MTVYVDPLRDYHAVTGRGLPGLWCHMLTDGDLDELHGFAALVGIPRRRFQNHARHPHYDLNPTARQMAVALGAVEVTTNQLYKILKARENGAQPMSTTAHVSRGFYFEEFEPGQVFVTPGRTITEADIVAFAALSGDWNQIHTDAVYAAQHIVGQRVAHGLLGLSIAVGLAVRLRLLEDTLLVFRQIDQWKFSQPIYIGDTIHARITIAEKRRVPRLQGGMVTETVDLLNQNDQIVQFGLWKVLVKSNSENP